MTPLESARAKLENPERGALTTQEIVALLQASTVTPKSKMVPAFIEEILEVLAPYTAFSFADEGNEAKARAELIRLFTEKEVSVAIVKTWADTDFNKITSFGVPK